MCRHIAFILDGNRRWGKTNKVSLTDAYKKGSETLQDIVLHLIKLKIPYATMYGFSFENWNRSLYEISVILISFLDFLNANINFFMENNIKIQIIGDLSFFDDKIYSVLMELEYLTKNNSAIVVQLAISYSGQNEILRAATLWAENGGDLKDYFFTAGVPDPDLLIRTGGCQRLSNFLLWQVAYTEFFFLDKFWPDFTAGDLNCILDQYNKIAKNHGV